MKRVLIAIGMLVMIVPAATAQTDSMSRKKTKTVTTDANGNKTKTKKTKTDVGRKLNSDAGGDVDMGGHGDPMNMNGNAPARNDTTKR